MKKKRPQPRPNPPDEAGVPEATARQDHCPIVGLGASAGGLEAFQQFLEHMPPASGMAFVLVQHLDPNRDSLLPELLAKHTSLPVKQLTDGQEVESNHVYLAPPNTSVTMSSCCFRVIPLPQGASPHLPIDAFFRSMARDQGENVIGIVLSGTGSDGTLGLGAIKQGGGLTIAQAPELAKFDGMPRSAISSGMVDHVLPVQQMPGVILEYMRHAVRLRGKDGAAAAEQGTLKALGKIFPLLHRRTGHDFSRYKQSTLLRRVQRRVQVTYSASLEAYVELLRHAPHEVDELFKDLLIGVTQFFRDTEAFDALADKVLPEIFREKAAQTPVRIWVPGCATGEEPFSLAMLLSDYMAAHHLRHKVQIFATDIDAEALDVARKGQYPGNICEQLAPALFQRYFVHRDTTCELTEQVREMCVFSLHNLVKDPPFSHLDLISCRNLLIYLEADLQKKLLPLFHYALNPSGFLFLGPSENVAARSELFRVLDKKHRIFQRKPAILGPMVHLPTLDPGRLARFQPQAPAVTPPLKEQTVVRSIERVLLEELAPPGMVINEQGEVLYFSGQVGDYLQPASGVPSNKVLNLVRKSLRLDLRTTLHRAVTTREPAIRENLPVRIGREVRHINLIVRPLAEVAKEELFLLAFQPVPPSPAGAAPESPTAPAEPNSPVIQQLEIELRATRDELQNTIEELETSNEELRSANEELLSMNEELQSTNEEMQTSKEELQSLNEELQRKMEELDLAHTDLQNFVQSSQVPTLFLDQELRLRKFSPALEQVVSLREKDLGSTLAQVAPDLASPELTRAAKRTLRTLEAQEEQIWLTPRQACYIVRTTPYRTLEGTVLGVVITFTDITELKRAQEHRTQLASIVENSIDAIVGVGLDNLIRTWNKGAERIYGWKAEEVIGRPMTLLIPADRHAEFLEIHTRVARGEDVGAVETVRLTKAQKPVEVAVSYSLIRNSAGAVMGFSSIARDITERKRALMTSHLLASIVESSDDAIVSKDLNGIITSWNRGATRIFGYTAEEIVGKPITTIIPADRQSEEPMILERLRRGERIDHFQTVRQRKDGTLIDVSVTISPIRQPGSNVVIGASKIAHDITEAKRAERFLAEARERLAQANQELETRVQLRTKELAESNSQLEALVYSIAHDLRAPLRSMQSFSSMLVEDYGPVLDETGQNYAQRIMRSAEALDRLILDLLAYGRLGQGELELVPVNLDSAWTAAQFQNDQLVEQSRAVLEVERPLPRVLAHETTLTQVLANLLNNGLRFVGPGVQPHIRFRAETLPGTVRMWVEDNGIGIDPKHHERVFGLFQQLDRKTYGGTGLGLAIVRRGIERMGGRVGLESAQGQGTRFWMELPAAAPAAREVAD